LYEQRFFDSLAPPRETGAVFLWKFQND
jgi:hypothetical protein